MISQEEVFYYCNSMEVQNIIRSMVQQYHDFPPDVVQEFNLLPRQPPVQPRPHTSVDSTRIVRDTNDHDSQRHQASQLLNQQSRITDMHAYQVNAIASEQSFGMFHVNEGMPVRWPAPAPPLMANYNNTSPPQTPRRSTTYEELMTPSQPRVMMTPSRIPLPESLMTPGFGNYSQSTSQLRGRYSMETPGTGRRNLPEFMDNYTPATF
jgi:hypothetical protein